MPEPIACPRHPGTQTRLRCSRCATPICPQCMLPGATGYLCRTCARGDQRSQVRTRPVATSSTGRVTTGLLVLIAVGALVTAAQGGMSLAGGAFGSATRAHLDFAMFAPSVADGQWYRLITSAFLHYGPLHLAMNAYGLFLLGPMLESRLGSGRFALLFVVSTLAAGAGSAVIEPFGLAAGASGALFGFLGAAVVLERRRGVTRLLESQVGVWLLLGFVMTFAVPGLSIGGHLGGAIGGAATGATLFALERRRERPLGVLASLAIGMLATCVAVVASVAAVTSIGPP